MHEIFVVYVVLLLGYVGKSFVTPPRLVKTQMRLKSQGEPSFIESIGNHCIEDCVAECLKGKFGENLEILKARPGLPFSLGVDQWKANGFSGSIETWCANPCLDWLCRSRMSTCSAAPSTANTSSAVDQLRAVNGKSDSSILLEELQIYAAVSEVYDLPNLKMSIGLWQLPLGSRAYKLQLDYVPREDILASLNYFDRYFTGLDEQIYNATRSVAVQEIITFHEPSDSALSRMLTSAFAVSIDVAEDQTDIVRQLCESHMKRWCKWITEANELEDSTKQQQMRSRDLIIQGLHFDDFRFRMARVMGADFAPKAADVAASLVGPKINI